MISIDGLFKTHGRDGAAREVLAGVDLTVEDGDFVCVVGRSGSGKTTLLNILGGLDTIYGGEVVVAGRRLCALSDDQLSAFRSQVVGFVFQDFGLVDSLDASENVMLPLTFSSTGSRLSAREGRHRAAALLERVGLEQRSTARPAELSGGEKQRLGLARALVGRPQLLLCDELTGNLDRDTAVDIIDLLEDLHGEQGLTIVAATHDEAVAEAAGTVYRLHEGRLEPEAVRR